MRPHSLLLARSLLPLHLDLILGSETFSLRTTQQAFQRGLGKCEAPFLFVCFLCHFLLLSWLGVGRSSRWLRDHCYTSVPALLDGAQTIYGFWNRVQPKASPSPNPIPQMSATVFQNVGNVPHEVLPITQGIIFRCY